MALIGAALTWPPGCFCTKATPATPASRCARACWPITAWWPASANSACSPWRWRAISARVFSVHPLRPVFLMRHLGLNEQQFIYLFGPAVCGIMWARFSPAAWRPPATARKSSRWATAVMAIAAVSNLLYNPGCRPPCPGACCRWPATPSACRWSPHRHPLPDGLSPACAAPPPHCKASPRHCSPAWWPG